jgi:putative ABC transport system substrate-binding protein
MEEATGAPSSFAVWDPKRLRASGRDGEKVMTESPSPLKMLLSRHTKRREFMTLLGGAAATWPLGARAQQPAVPVVGYLNSGSPEAFAHLVTAFRKGLSETGYVEGRNLAVEFRWAQDQSDRLPELAADLVRRQVAVIAAVGNADPALAAKAATATIPIVFASGVDPVKAGLVTSLNRPGGNVTGISGISADLAGKRLGLLHAAAPGVTRIAMLNATSSTAQSIARDVKAAGSALGLQIDVLNVANGRDIDTAFASLAQTRPEALLVGSDSLFTSRRVQLVLLAVKLSVPAIFAFRENAEAGGLMSYGPDTTDVNRQVGIYAGRILKGEKPADLPVMQASKFEFVINLQAARVMGIEIPTTLLAIADEVIE